MIKLQDKPIRGYEDIYSIDADGNVYSYHTNRVIKTKTAKNGYKIICLHKNGKRKWLLVHRLVADAFIENPENKSQVNHKDLDKKNNSVNNLEWVTSSENMQHAKQNGKVNTKEHQNKLRNICGYLTIEQARNIRNIYRTRKITQKELGRMFNVTEDVVYHIVNNHTYKEAI
jgi:hypothetical protein